MKGECFYCLLCGEVLESKGDEKKENNEERFDFAFCGRHKVPIVVARNRDTRKTSLTMTQLSEPTLVVSQDELQCYYCGKFLELLYMYFNIDESIPIEEQVYYVYRCAMLDHIWAVQFLGEYITCTHISIADAQHINESFGVFKDCPTSLIPSFFEEE
jgi:hypothetical protein